jgi:E3 ubiquitin-protein ligase EDD1
MMAATRSELLLVEEDTKALWRWRWSDPASAVSLAPSAERLGLSGRRVTQLVACPARAVVSSSDGAVTVVADACARLSSSSDNADADADASASHVDSSFSLDRPAVVHDVFKSDPITQLNASATLCCAVTEGGKAYWWGVPPVAARSAMLAAHGKLRKTRFQSRCIKPGDTVYLKASPVFRPGCIGFNARGGRPALGRLLDTAWSLTDKCRFEVLGGGAGSAGERDPVVEEVTMRTLVHFAFARARPCAALVERTPSRLRAPILPTNSPTYSRIPHSSTHSHTLWTPPLLTRISLPPTVASG